MDGIKDTPKDVSVVALRTMLLLSNVLIKYQISASAQLLENMYETL